MKRKVVLVVAGLAVCILVLALTAPAETKTNTAVWQRPLVTAPENNPFGMDLDSYARFVTNMHRSIRNLYNLSLKMQGEERTNRWSVIGRYLRRGDMKDALRVLRREPNPALNSLHRAIERQCSKWGSPPEWFTNNAAKVQGP